MSIDSTIGKPAEKRFLGLEYKDLSKFRKFYIFLRTKKWYDKVSQKCIPSSEDHTMIKSFLTNDLIQNSDIAIIKIRNEYYYLIKDDSILNAMRICA